MNKKFHEVQRRTVSGDEEQNTLTVPEIETRTSILQSVSSEGWDCLLVTLFVLNCTEIWFKSENTRT